MIDTWYNNSQFEGENKVISRFITIEIQRAKTVGHWGRERNECWSNFQQHFFSSSHLKAGVRTTQEKQRDRTVKNPSEAFNLLLQQNFISTLIFFQKAKSNAKKLRSLYTIETNISCFSFARFVWEISFSPQWKLFRKARKTAAAKDCINASNVYIHILIFFPFAARDERKICVTVVCSRSPYYWILLIFLFYRVLKNAHSKECE